MFQKSQPLDRLAYDLFTLICKMNFSKLQAAASFPPVVIKVIQWNSEFSMGFGEWNPKCTSRVIWIDLIPPKLINWLAVEIRFEVKFRSSESLYLGQGFCGCSGHPHQSCIDSEPNRTLVSARVVMIPSQFMHIHFRWDGLTRQRMRSFSP